jgi:hypothetical protein
MQRVGIAFVASGACCVTRDTLYRVEADCSMTFANSRVDHLQRPCADAVGRLVQCAFIRHISLTKHRVTGLISGGIMAELEVRVISEHREGLLVELGRVVSEHDHVLVRQRLSPDARGTSLTLVLRGPDERRSALEHALVSHPRVIRLESPQRLPGEHAADAVDTPTELTAPPRALGYGIPSGADVARVERMLPSLAKDYPRIFPWLINLEYAVTAEAREASLHLAGRRAGAWVFRRDFAFGARLALGDALKRIVLPALRELVSAELRDEQLHIRGCPLCQPGGLSGGRFFCGFIEGLLADALSSGVPCAAEVSCHCHGGAECVFDVSP